MKCVRELWYASLAICRLVTGRWPASLPLRSNSARTRRSSALSSRRAPGTGTGRGASGEVDASLDGGIVLSLPFPLEKVSPDIPPAQVTEIKFLAAIPACAGFPQVTASRSTGKRHLE